MSHIQTMIDPCNHKNYYIFGGWYNSTEKNKCWYFNHDTQRFNQINDIPKHKTQKKAMMHNCARFETINDNKYALIYGGDYFDHSNATYNIYDFKNQKWNDIALQLNNQWFNNDNIMKRGVSKYGRNKT